MEPAVRCPTGDRSDKLLTENPFGVPIAMGGWAGSGGVAEFGLTHWAPHKAFPQIIDGEAVFRLAELSVRDPSGLGHLDGLERSAWCRREVRLRQQPRRLQLPSPAAWCPAN